MSQQNDTFKKDNQLKGHLLEQSQQLLDAFFKQELDGFFLMMLDEPIRWDDSVDKEAVLDYVFDHQHVTRANHHMFQQYRMSAEDFIGATPRDFFAHDIPQGRALWRKFLDAGQLHIETEERRGDGETVWVDGDYICLYDAQGYVTGLFGIQQDITAEKTAQQHLTLQAAALNATANAMVITDVTGSIQWCNPAFTKLTGYTPEEALGKNPRQLVRSGVYNSDFYKSLWDTILTGEVWHGQLLNRRKDGTLYTEEQTITPVKNASGIITHFIAVKEDVTERQQMEQALRRSEARFRAMIASMNDIVFTLDMEQRHTGVYGQWLDNLDYTPEFFLGKTAAEIFGSAAASIHEEHNRLALSGRNVVYEWQSGSGTPEDTQYYQTHLSPILDDNGAVTGLVGIGRDITRLKQTESALADSESRYRSVVESLSEGIVLQGQDGMIYACNAAAERVLGLTRDQMMGRNSIDPRWRAIHDDGSPFPGDTHPAMVTLRTGEPQINVIMGVYKPEGTLTWIQINSQPIFNDDDPLPAAVVASFADITEIKEAENRSLALALEQERVNILMNFIQNASHEFRTPLAVIQSSLYLHNRIVNPERKRQKLQRIQEQIERLTRLIDMLVLMTKLDSGIQLQLGSVNVRENIQQVLNNVQDDITEKYLSVHTEFADVPPIKADVEYLVIALQQLVDNAVRFVPPGGVVTVRTIKRGNSLLIEVQNTGSSIDAADMPHIFERFYRRDSAHTTPGFGLGLAIAQKAMLEHHGIIEAENLSGGGCVFRITLPMNQS